MLKNRLFVQVTIFFIIGVALGVLFSLPIIFSIIGFALGGIFLLFIFLLRKKEKINTQRFFYLFLVFVFVFALCHSSLYCERRSFDKTFLNEEITIEGVIVESNSRYTDISVIKGDLFKGIKIRVYDLKINNSENEVVIFKKGTFKLYLSECPNYIKAEGVSYYGSGEAFDLSDTKGYYFKKAAFHTREFFVSEISNKYNESPLTASFINALIFGETSGLSDKFYSSYGRLGITHLIAVSGFHFTVIVMSLFAFLYVFRIHYKKRCLICIPFSIFYCLLTGSSPSSVRATIMIIVYLILRYMIYKTDSLSSLSIAAFIILFVNPYSFYSTSFVLSFLATFALSIAPPFFDIFDLYHKPKVIKILNKMAQSLFVTLIISMFIAPTLYSRFQTFSLITPIANLVLSSVFPILMYISIIAALLSPFDSFDFLIKYVSDIVEWFHVWIDKAAELKGISIAPSGVLINFVFITTICCVLAALFLKRKFRAISIKLIIGVFVLSVFTSVLISNYTIKNYNQVMFSDDGNSMLVIDKGRTVYIIENEKEFNNEFLLSNNILDVNSLVIKNISNNDNIFNKLSSYSVQFRIEKIYLNTLQSSMDDLPVLSIDNLDSDIIEISNKYGVDIMVKSEYNILWLGDDSRGINRNNYVKKLVLSKSFFDKKSNIVSLPYDFDELYVPNNCEDTYAMKFISINFPDAEIYYIDDFKHKIKNE